jgi:uncharacterized protein (UPF0261 family)
LLAPEVARAGEAMKRIYVVGTADTKGEELAFVAARVAEAGGVAVVVDVGTRAPVTAADVSAGEVAAFHLDGAERVLGRRRPRRRW